MITFNNYFEITDKSVEHLNILMDNDLEAFIDPYHIANNLDNMIAKRMYIKSKSFLETLNRTYIIPKNKKSGMKFLSHLREANEYHLGYSRKNKGKGIGYIKAETIFDSMSKNKFVKSEITITNEAHNVLLLVDGIGQDNMSDTLANVCRDVLAEFTLKQCIKYGIDVAEFEIEYYDHILKKWNKKNVLLPQYKGKKIILVPKFLTSKKRVYPNHYNWFMAKNFISPDILNGVINLKDKTEFIYELKDGSEKLIIKKVVNKFGKLKSKLIEFETVYNGSLLDFQDHAKLHYLSIDNDDLLDLYDKAS